MYLRTTARANKDGSVVRYLALAHNQRVGAATKANVLLNLGREDRLDLEPADSPRHPGSPPSTPPEQQKRSHPASGRAWTHARLVATRPFSQLNPHIQAPRLPTNCGTRAKLPHEPREQSNLGGDDQRPGLVGAAVEGPGRASP